MKPKGFVPVFLLCLKYKEVKAMSYEERLEKLGYAPQCAREIVRDYREAQRMETLREYIDYKESVRRSIHEHVAEVIG